MCVFVFDSGAKTITKSTTKQPSFGCNLISSVSLFQRASAKNFSKNFCRHYSTLVIEQCSKGTLRTAFFELFSKLNSMWRGDSGSFVSGGIFDFRVIIIGWG